MGTGPTAISLYAKVRQQRYFPREEALSSNEVLIAFLNSHFLMNIALISEIMSNHDPRRQRLLKTSQQDRSRKDSAVCQPKLFWLRQIKL